MKKIFRLVVIRILWWQVQRLRVKHNPKVVGVAGSVGKTTTKHAIVNILEQKYKIAWESGNYNDVVSIPLVFFSQHMPSLMNPFAWLKTFIHNESVIRRKYRYDVVVLELGTDHSGDMKQLVGNLDVDILALTAISPEHMEMFADMDEVAEDELIATKISKQTIVDSSSVDPKYINTIKEPIIIGASNTGCIVTAGKIDSHNLLRGVHISYEGSQYRFDTPIIGKQNLPSLAFAVVVGQKLGLNKSEIIDGLKQMKPVSGRMNTLPGRNGSLLVDDTYNSSPEAVNNALSTLAELPGKQKIAVLGQMNELGKFSQQMHEEIGRICKPDKLNLVVTLGNDANNYLAAEAEKNGCKVIRCPSPYRAAEVVSPLLSKSTVVLLKGSQNGVFTEETTRLLLENKEDSKQLVRQSEAWIKIKKSQFKDFV